MKVSHIQRVMLERAFATPDYDRADAICDNIDQGQALVRKMRRARKKYAWAFTDKGTAS